MPTTGTRSRKRPRLLPIGAVVVWLCATGPTRASGFESEVTLWIEPGKAVATSLLSGRRETPLDVQETVLGHAASGINGIVVTSRRLLGFSSRTLTWSEVKRDVEDKMRERKTLPAFSVVRTEKHLYGFRGVDSTWIEEPFSVRETVLRTVTTDYGVVFVTNERLIGFASLLGDFSPKHLGVHERITTIDDEHGLIIVTTSVRTLVFGSRLSGWEEFE